MLSGIYQVKQQFFSIATSWRWLFAFLLITLMPALHAADLNTLNIDSSPGQPLQAQLALSHLHPDTDINCFNLEQAPGSTPVHLEFTSLDSQQGTLMLWSDSAITAALPLTLVDRCQHTRQPFTIQPDNTVLIPVQSPLIKKIEAPITIPIEPAPPPTHAEAPSIPVEAYTALQAQINDLQQSFKQIQTKSDALYASNLAQANILTTLKAQLVQLQNENQMLRTLVVALGLALIASGFFFADWLRRNAAAPKTIKSNQPNKSPEASPTPADATEVANRLAAKAFSSTLPPASQPGHATAMNTPTQPPPHTKTGGRLKAVPMHANDDTVMPQAVPQKVSSQQSTQTVMQDASRLFTHGRVNQAIEHLQQHLAKHPKCSPWMWLYLLDLLSKEGKQQEFDIVAGECRKHFNLNVEHAPDLKQQGIESFPRVMKALQEAWGTPQVIALIDDLVYNTRLVPRMGFERSVFEDLMLLKEIACQTQNLPAVPPAPKTNPHEEPIDGNLRELQQLSEDIYILAPIEHTPFQYWTDFTFELDEPSTLRKSA